VGPCTFLLPLLTLTLTLLWVQDPDTTDTGSRRYCREVDLGDVHAASMMTIPLPAIARSCSHLSSLHSARHTQDRTTPTAFFLCFNISSTSALPVLYLFFLLQHTPCFPSHNLHHDYDPNASDLQISGYHDLPDGQERETFCLYDPPQLNAKYIF